MKKIFIITVVVFLILSANVAFAEEIVPTYSINIETNISENITEPSNLSAEVVEELLSDSLKNTGVSDALVSGEEEYGINLLFILGIINHESAYGTSYSAENRNNLGGVKGTGDAGSDDGWKVYSSKAVCVADMYRFLSEMYIEKGRTTLTAISPIYAGGSTEWANHISYQISDLADSAESIIVKSIIEHIDNELYS